jgi:hypothetical protein
LVFVVVVCWVWFFFWVALFGVLGPLS